MPGRESGDLRGNNKDRRRRKEWMLSHFGDGTITPCYHCGVQLDYKSMTVDRFPVCGHDRGRYTRDNVVPACETCNYGRCSKCIDVDASCHRQLPFGQDETADERSSEISEAEELAGALFGGVAG